VCAVLAVLFLFTFMHIKPSQKADVAIHSGRGTWDDSVAAAESMFRWMDLSVELVSAEFINTNGLKGFHVRAFQAETCMIMLKTFLREARKT
jgi:hypothetical protein